MNITYTAHKYNIRYRYLKTEHAIYLFITYNLEYILVGVLTCVNSYWFIYLAHNVAR